MNYEKPHTGKVDWFYDGEWLDDCKTGYGKICYSDGRVIEGNWVNG